jgi:hypothetical protein
MSPGFFHEIDAVVPVVSGFSRTVIASVKQSDRIFRCRRTQVHVTLRRREIRVP